MRSLKLRRYYVDRPGDSALTRIKNRLVRRPVSDFPQNLQIQTVTGCNADCLFCPYGSTHADQPKGRMEDDLFDQILQETAGHNVRRVSPYLMNEPLLDPDLCRRIRLINRTVPHCRVVLTTNGHYLTEKLSEEILDLEGGLHEIYVSVQGVDADAYARTMRGNMDLDRTMVNVMRFVEDQRRRRMERPKLWVTMVDTKLIDVHRAVAFWRSIGVASKYTTLENRGGNIDQADSLSRHGSMSFYDDCPRPFRQGYILFNGDMVLCCADYSRAQVLGNITRSSVHEVWNGPVAREIRRKYIDRERRLLPLCAGCKIDRVRQVTADVERFDWGGEPAAGTTGPDR